MCLFFPTLPFIYNPTSFLTLHHLSLLCSILSPFIPLLIYTSMQLGPFSILSFLHSFSFLLLSSFSLHLITLPLFSSYSVIRTIPTHFYATIFHLCTYYFSLPLVHDHFSTIASFAVHFPLSTFHFYLFIFYFHSGVLFFLLPYILWFLFFHSPVILFLVLLFPFKLSSFSSSSLLLTFPSSVLDSPRPTRVLDKSSACAASFWHAQRVFQDAIGACLSDSAHIAPEAGPLLS